MAVWRRVARLWPVALMLAVCGCGGSSAAGGIPTAPPATSGGTPVPTVSAGRIPSLLETTWQSYKHDFIQGDGRVVDPTRNAVSTSEGESYAMLRSVWTGDRGELDTVWHWTQANLQVRHDHLFAYLWGRHGNGQWGPLSTRSATDADEDIALALLLASRRWGDSAYRSQAQAILGDIWAHEVATVRGKPILTAGDWAPGVTNPGPVINPSYFAPYEYRLFAEIDAGHPWEKLVDSSYRILAACSGSPLGGNRSADLPPNWCAVTPASGQVEAYSSVPAATVYGYDAFRTMWRIAVDWEWNHEPRARAYLTGSTFLRDTWKRDGRLLAQYNHDGTPVSNAEDITAYGGDLGNLLVAAPDEAQSMVRKEMLSTVASAGGQTFWDKRYDYYEQNWLWFGLALSAGKIQHYTG